MRAQLVAAVSATVCGLLILGGCGQKAPEPKPIETESANTAPSPTVSPAPSMPAEAKKKGAKAAEAFVRHYVQLINHAQGTGDVEALAAAESPECRSCDAPRKAFADLYDSGGHLEGGELRISRSQAVANPATKGFLVDLVLEFGPQTVVKGDGTEQRLKGGRIFLAVQIQPDPPKAWVVTSSTRSE